jgi:hypothetical protein
VVSERLITLLAPETVDTLIGQTHLFHDLHPPISLERTKNLAEHPP